MTSSITSRSRRRIGVNGVWATPAAVLLILWLAWSSYGFELLAGIGQYLVVEQEPAPADVIVSTYSSHSTAGTEKVLELFHAGLAESVLLSSSRISVAGVQANDTAPLVRRYLIARGIPQHAIYEIDVLPTSEHEEAAAIRRAMESKPWRSALIVVIDFRSRRTMATLKAQFKDRDVRLISQAFRSEIGESVALDLSRWWESRQGVDALLNEYPRLVYYFVRGRL